ncbi:MAG: hypothetical protein HQL49_11255 [Gammaproteobacteria bacterium]|nr:hypothetical protein [Gammaproteobacteria bacterium]
MPLTLGPLLTPLQLQLHLRSPSPYQEVTLKRFDLHSGNGLLAVKASGAVNFALEKGEIEAQIDSTLRTPLMSEPPLSGSGQLSLPLLLTLTRGERLSVEGLLKLSDVTLGGSGWQLQQANGNIALQEELIFNESGEVNFLYTLNSDPFQRVDFTRMQPYLEKQRQLQITSLQLGEQTFGPLNSSLNLEQNLLHLQQFTLELLGGNLAGQFYFDAHPEGWKIGLLGRISQIDLGRLLTATSKIANSDGENRLNARVAIEFDLSRMLLEGRIDISDMSSQQLLQLLEIIDPNYDDEQLAQVRSALGITYPRTIRIEMQRGLMAMEVDLASLPKISIHALPLTPLLQQFTSGYLQRLERLPLQPSSHLSPKSP